MIAEGLCRLVKKFKVFKVFLLSIPVSLQGCTASGTTIFSPAAAYQNRQIEKVQLTQSPLSLEMQKRDRENSQKSTTPKLVLGTFLGEFKNGMRYYNSQNYEQSAFSFDRVIAFGFLGVWIASTLQWYKPCEDPENKEVCGTSAYYMALLVKRGYKGEATSHELSKPIDYFRLGAKVGNAESIAEVAKVDNKQRAIDDAERRDQAAIAARQKADRDFYARCNTPVPPPDCKFR